MTKEELELKVEKRAATSEMKLENGRTRMTVANTDFKWYDDRDEVVAFARWFWEGAYSIRGTVGEILDYFEAPWKFDEEYKTYKEDTNE